MTRSTTEDFAPVLDALGIAQHQHEAFLAYASNIHGNPDSVLPKKGQPGGWGEAENIVAEFEEAYCGEWDSKGDFAESDDGGACGLFDGLPKDSIAERYFDWEMWTRDLFISDYWSARSGDGYGCFVFRNL